MKVMQQQAVQSAAPALVARSIDQQATEELSPRSPSKYGLDPDFWNAVKQVQEEESSKIPKIKLTEPKSDEPKMSGFKLKNAREVSGREWETANNEAVAKEMEELKDPSLKRYKYRDQFETAPDAAWFTKQGKIRRELEEQIYQQQAGSSEAAQSTKSKKQSQTADGDTNAGPYLRLG